MKDGLHRFAVVPPPGGIELLQIAPLEADRTAGGSSSPSTSFAVVVLPQPDSPTTPSVRPASIVNEIPSTARTTPRSPPKIPRLAWKCLLRPAASITAIRLYCSEPAYPKEWNPRKRASSALSGTRPGQTPAAPRHGSDRKP